MWLAILLALFAAGAAPTKAEAIANWLDAGGGSAQSGAYMETESCVGEETPFGVSNSMQYYERAAWARYFDPLPNAARRAWTLYE